MCETGGVSAAEAGISTAFNAQSAYHSWSEATASFWAKLGQLTRCVCWADLEDSGWAKCQNWHFLKVSASLLHSVSPFDGRTTMDAGSLPALLAGQWQYRAGPHRLVPLPAFIYPDNIQTLPIVKTHA